MIELIWIALAILGLLMAKHGGRAMGRYIRGNINIDDDLGTLASNTGLLLPTQVVNERMLVTSTVASMVLQGFTKGDNIGPFQVGIAHSDYSLAEVEAWIEQTTGAWQEADLVVREISNRKIRRLGILETDGAGAVGDTLTLKGGRMVKTKLNWILTTGQGLNYWIYNLGSAPVATTDPNIHVEGHANLFPK